MPWWVHGGILLGLLVANLSLYRSALQLGFFSVDDGDYVQNNPYIDSFRASSLARIFLGPYAANYAPLNILSYAMDVAFSGGKQPFAFHLSNVFWHGWVVCMVYLLAITIRAEIVTAAAAALLFLVHPAHVEVVAWISSRKDLVATGFAALAMTCYLLCRRQLGSRRRWWYAASLFSFLLASAGKQSVLLLPAVMLVWDLLVEQRRDWRMLVDKIPFALIAAFFGWMTWHAQPGTNQGAQAFVLAGTELTNLWLITGLGQYVLYRAAPDPAAWSQAARLAIIIGAALAWALPLLFNKLRQPVRAGLGYWVLIQMVPPMVLCFIVPITDRYLFLPSVGACILLADLAVPKVRGVKGEVLAARRESARPSHFSRRTLNGASLRRLLRPTTVGCTLVMVLSAVWAAKTSQYLAEWRDPRSVWYGAHLKTKTPQVAEFLGDAYQEAGNRIEAFLSSGGPLQVTNELELARAVLRDEATIGRLQVEWVGRVASPTNSLAYRDRLWALAWEQYERAVAGRGKLSAPNLYMNRGRLLVSQGKFQQAIADFETARLFAQNSNYDEIRQGTVTHALYAIGVAHWHLRHYKEAQQWLLKAQELQRKSGQVWISELDLQVERIKSMGEHER